MRTASRRRGRRVCVCDMCTVRRVCVPRVNVHDGGLARAGRCVACCTSKHAYPASAPPTQAPRSPSPAAQTLNLPPPRAPPQVCASAAIFSLLQGETHEKTVDLGCVAVGADGKAAIELPKRVLLGLERVTVQYKMCVCMRVCLCGCCGLAHAVMTRAPSATRL